MVPNHHRAQDPIKRVTMTEVNPLRRIRVAADRAGQSVGPSSEQDQTSALTSALIGAGRGDEEAFSRVYDLTSPMVHGVVLKVVRDPAMAEEVTQEVYLELWRIAPRFQLDRGSARGWIATMAHRRAVDLVRSEQSRRRRDEREGERADRPFDHVVEDVVDRLDRSKLDRSLARLSETQREAVTLAYYGGKTYREVGVLLDIPEGTAKTRIRDGLIKLRDDFGVST